MAQVCVLAVCSVACVKVLICSIAGFSGTYALHKAERYGEMIEYKKDVSP